MILSDLFVSGMINSLSYRIRIMREVIVSHSENENNTKNN